MDSERAPALREATISLGPDAAGVSRARNVRLHGKPDLVSVEDATLSIAWDLDAQYEYPATWTNAEAQDRFIAALAQHARTACLMVIGQLPDDVVPIVFPQLKELAEYETRMAEVRREKFKPGIREEWKSIPISTAP